LLLKGKREGGIREGNNLGRKEGLKRECALVGVGDRLCL